METPVFDPSAGAGGLDQQKDLQLCMLVGTGGTPHQWHDLVVTRRSHWCLCCKERGENLGFWWADAATVAKLDTKNALNGDLLFSVHLLCDRHKRTEAKKLDQVMLTKRAKAFLFIVDKDDLYPFLNRVSHGKPLEEWNTGKRLNAVFDTPERAFVYTRR